MTRADRQEQALEHWLRMTVGAGDEPPTLTAIGARFGGGPGNARRLLDRLASRGLIEASRTKGQRLRITWKG